MRKLGRFSFQMHPVASAEYKTRVCCLLAVCSFSIGLFKNVTRTSFYRCEQTWYSWFQTFAVFWILYVFFWVFTRGPIVVCRRFGTLYRFHLQGLDVECEVFILYIQPLKMELIEGSETSANYNRTPGKYPKEYIRVFSSLLKSL